MQDLQDFRRWYHNIVLREPGFLDKKMKVRHLFLFLSLPFPGGGAPEGELRVPPLAPPPLPFSCVRGVYDVARARAHASVHPAPRSPGAPVKRAAVGHGGRHRGESGPGRHRSLRV